MPAEKRCSGCRKTWYCRQACQKEHWIFHIFDCKLGQPISTVYHLARACRRNLIPVDSQTRKDYGFDKAGQAFGGKGESNLLGVYIGLFIYLDIPPQEVRKWRDEGRLIAGIKEVFEEIPPHARGGYYPWLMQNQFILDDSFTLDPKQVEDRARQTAVSNFLAAWARIGGIPKDATYDQIVHETNRWPTHKRSCWHLYTMFAGRCRPSPNLDAWRKFGFVSARFPGEELDFAREYDALLDRCTFDEFHAAYVASSIPDLFLRYGLQELPHNAHFCDVMADSPRSVKTVWELKNYIDILVSSDALSRPQPSPPLTADYGYVNCRTPEERTLLDEAYKRLFMETSADPLELHKACLEGDLFRFVGTFVKFAPWAEKYKRLLRNIYPSSTADPGGERCVVVNI
ncbi:hypothetical protein NUW54_g12106 [Trametes sanguinea]|uniref:Uncharacterized protein n=1 Tax=Trametes sanguinea TaxID=158606 RepID=A0ACC1N2B1_9APHY|nr:hypothetical protein NUW54_g12106 [Trametes sanguinea]